MAESLLPSVAGILIAGVAAQWLAWRVGLPSILLLLTFGLIAGPITGWVRPDEIFGDLLFPVVSLSVALILYEGGLTLKLSELPEIGAVVRNLVTVGMLITWGIGTLAAFFICGLNASLSLLIGAVLVVTGPTVVAPLLRHIRPSGAVGPILRWEGIVIDPIGALLTVLVFETIMIGEAKQATMHIVYGLLKTVFAGGGFGLGAAGLLVILLERYWIADFLRNAVSVMIVVAVFTVSNAVQHESGLLAVTVMGIALANQKRVDVENIVEFKENLRVLLISTLFIVLAARLNPDDLKSVAIRGLAFAAVLMLVARPLCVLVSTLRSPLTFRQRAFLACMAPRGIVAAAIASVFAMRLEDRGYEGAATLVPLTFITLIATVVIYGLCSPFVARRLGVAEAHPQGVLFVGAHAVAREIASLLSAQGFRVMLVDTNRHHINAARMAGLPTVAGNVLAEHTLDSIDLGGIGRLLAVTPNDWVNTLAVHRFSRIFERAECFQLPPHQRPSRKKEYKYLHGRWAFDEAATYASLDWKLTAGFTAKATNLTETFDYEAFRTRYGDSAVALFAIDADRRLRVLATDQTDPPQPDETVISFVKDDPSE